MAFDQKLADRVKNTLKGKRGMTQKPMFGGICFLHNGNMLCGIDNKKRLMVRVGPEQYESTLKLKFAKKMDFTGRPMKGMVYIDSAGFKTKASLEKWIKLGLNFTKSLPKK